MSDSFDIRVNNARKDFMNMDGTLWENLERLWERGYSLRVLATISGISRSKLQRYFSENGLGRDDDIGTQNRDLRVREAKKLFANGYCREAIAERMGVNVRTVGSYLRQKDRSE